jgi:hypothetical protein
MAGSYFSDMGQQEFDKYYFQKSLVSLITYVLLNLMNLTRSPETINLLLEVVSLISLFVALVFWWKIAKVAKLSESNYWIVFIGLFGSQLFVKISPYSQDGSDNASFALGMAVLYFMVSRSFFGLWACYLISFLVQPQLRILIVPLILFHQYNPRLQQYTNLRRKVVGRLTLFIFLSIFISSSLLFLIWLPLSHGVSHTILTLLPLSIMISALFLRNLLSPLLLSIDFSRLIQYVLSVKNVVFLFGAIEIVFQLLVRFVGMGEVMSINSTLPGQLYFLLGSYFHAVAMPVLWLVAPMLFFGPVVILFVIFYKDIFSKQILVENFGFAVSLVLIVLLVPNTESRHHIAYLPWLFYLLVRKVHFKARYVFVFFAPLMLITSRFYGSYAPTNLPNDPFLMSWGPWMSKETYLTGVFVVVPLLCLHYLFRHRIAIRYSTLEEANGIR